MKTPFLTPQAAAARVLRTDVADRDVDRYGRACWLVYTDGKQPHWNNDGLTGGDGPTGPSSWSLILSYFEEDPDRWLRFKAGGNGTKADTIANDIVRYLRANKGPTMKTRNNVKQHILRSYNKKYRFTCGLLKQTGFGEGSTYLTETKHERVCKDLERKSIIATQNLALI